MFNNLSITACEDITVRELLRLHQEGYSVYRTSHAGNWSLYKLLLSELGLPDCIWDATCIFRDTNNQPAYQLIGGERYALIEEISDQPAGSIKSLTPYHRVMAAPEMTLGHFHVKPLQDLFGPSVTSQSAVLLEYSEQIETVFGIMQKYAPEKLGRYIFPCGCMTELKTYDNENYHASCPHNTVSVKRGDLAESALGTLKDLKALLFAPAGYKATGGVFYSFDLVVAAFYLWAAWKFGKKEIYQLSGPDMISYATEPKFVRRIKETLSIIDKYGPKGLVPESLDARIVPVTCFRFGYSTCPNAVSKKVMAAHETIHSFQAHKRKFKDLPDVSRSIDLSLRGMLDIIEQYGTTWNIFYNSSKDAFYSQHDMLSSGTRLTIMDEYLDMPLAAMGIMLRTLSETERNLKNRLMKN